MSLSIDLHCAVCGTKHLTLEHLGPRAIFRVVPCEHCSTVEHLKIMEMQRNIEATDRLDVIGATTGRWPTDKPNFANTPKMPDPDKYERSMNGLRKLVCEPKMDGSGTLRGEGWDAAARKAWHFFERYLRKQS